MGVITTGQTFASGDQVTATKLNDIGNSATFTSAADTTDDSTLTLGSSKLKVKDLGITATQLATDSVTTIKIQNEAVTAEKLAPAAITAIMPTGSIISFAGSIIPTGWLLCDGSVQLRNIWSNGGTVDTGVPTDLFTAIGLTYTGPFPLNQFYDIPDLRGRVIAGADNMGGTPANELTGQPGGVDGAALGNIGGNQTHTLTTAQMPTHTHAVQQNIAIQRGDSSLEAANAEANLDGTSGPAGLNAAHNNVQPTIILNYIIKT
jgi:microcystin-dependent protein